MAKGDQEEGFPILEKEGVKYVEPIPGYLVKHYEPPRIHKLDDYARLIEDFEKRFFRNVDRGHEILAVRDIDKYIDQKREAYNAATGPEKELEGGMLCSALIRRSVDHAIQHIRLRIRQGGKDDPSNALEHRHLESLRKKIDEDYVETFGLPALRLSRGQPDRDDVLGEMRGEPFGIFTATLTDTPDKIHSFYRNRYLKVAEAMQCIDTTVASMAQMNAGGTPYHALHVQDSLAALAQAAKDRMQLQRDDAGFHDADLRLRAARNALLDIEQGQEKPPAHLPRDHRAQASLPPLALMLTKNAVNLIYDIAVTHDAQRRRAEELAASVQDFTELAARKKRTGRSA
jgi:hypothetical protein